MAEDLHVTNGHCSATSSSITVSWNNDPNAAIVEMDKGHTRVCQGTGSLTSCTDRRLKAHHTFTYTIQNWTGNRQHHGQLTETCSTNARSTTTFLMERNVNTPGEDTFDLSVPQGTMVTHYTHTNKTIKEGPWQVADTLMLPAGAQVDAPTVSLIQSFRTPTELQAFAQIKPAEGSDFLVAYQFSPGTGSQNPLPVTSHSLIDHVSGTPAFAQSDQGSFILLVPRKGVIEHFTHPSDTVKGDWTLVHTLKPPAGAQVVAIALAQSDGLGGFKAVVRVTSPQGDHLVGYEFIRGGSDNGDDGGEDDGDDGHDAGGSWNGPFDLVTKDGRAIDHVTGAPAFIQSINGEQERFELLVPGNGALSYYTNSSRSIKDPWTFVQTLKQINSDPTVAVSLIQARTLSLEAVARVSSPGGADFIVSYEFTPATKWQGPFTLTGMDGMPIPAGPPPIIIG